MKEPVKIDGVTAEELSSEYRISNLGKMEKEIKFLLEKLHGVARMSLVMVFEAGKRLVAVKRSLEHGEFLPWLKENFDLSERSARHYMKLYLHFEDKPSTILEDMSLTEAYVAAGVKKVLAPELDEDEEGELSYAGKADPEAEKANMVALFRRPTLSGVKLKNHRVDNVGGRIYYFRKDVGMAAPALDILLPKPPGLPEKDWIEFQSYHQIATELYLAKLEYFEETGLVEPPQDLRMQTAIDQLNAKRKGGRRVGPGYDDGTALPDPAEGIA